MTDVVQDSLALAGCLFMMLFFVLFGEFLFRLGEVSPYETDVNGILEQQGGFTPQAVRQIRTLDYDYRNGYLGNNAEDSFHVMPENDINNSVDNSSNDEKVDKVGKIVTGVKYRTVNHQGYGDPIYYRIFMSIPGLPRYLGNIFNITTNTYNAEHDAHTTSKVDLVDPNNANGGHKAHATEIKPQVIANYVKFFDDNKQVGNYITLKGKDGTRKPFKLPNGYYLTKNENNFVKLSNPNNRIVNVKVTNNKAGSIQAIFKPVQGSPEISGVNGVITDGKDGNPFTDLESDKGNLPPMCKPVKWTNPPKTYVGGKHLKFIIYYKVE